MLTDKALKALKPRERPYKRADEKGLYVLVTPTGSLLWRLKYRFGGVEKVLALGSYPDTTLRLAREKRDEARRLLAEGVDPSAARKAEKAARAGAETFRAVAEEWMRKGCPPQKIERRLAERTLAKTRQLLEQKLYPKIGDKRADEIEPPDLLKALRAIEAEGKLETAKRCRQIASRVFRYAVATGRATRNPAADLEGVLAPPPVKHRPALTDPRDVATLMRAIRAYGGQPATRAALEILALTFVRPGELRLAKWREFDFEAKLWTIPAERMKMRREHVVPLSEQAVAILRELQPITDRGPDSLVFPSLRPGRPLSENTLNVALRNMDYDTRTQHCAHGFRSTASTLLHELGWDDDVIECQLAHKRPGVGGIYNRAHRLAERARMMQAWADYLDGLRSGARIVAFAAK